MKSSSLTGFLASQSRLTTSAIMYLEVDPNASSDSIRRELAPLPEHPLDLLCLEGHAVLEFPTLQGAQELLSTIRAAHTPRSPVNAHIGIFHQGTLKGTFTSSGGVLSVEQCLELTRAA